MKINSKDFRATGKGVHLKKWPTKVSPFFSSKKEYEELLAEHVEKLSSRQQLQCASNRYALLLIFQGMDGSGKDGAVRHVTSGVNPRGCEVFGFKQPSPAELEHDFLLAHHALSAGARADWHFQSFLITSRYSSCGCIRRFSATRGFQSLAQVGMRVDLDRKRASHLRGSFVRSFQ
jgi:hypothetical protein